MIGAITSKEHKRYFGWIGTFLLLLIIPIKIIRFSDSSIFYLLIDNGPSFLGTSGLFFLFLSSKHKYFNHKIYQLALFTLIISISIELIQLIPRPGILARVIYTFDTRDLIVSVIGLVMSLIFTIYFIKKSEKIKNRV